MIFGKEENSVVSKLTIYAKCLQLLDFAGWRKIESFDNGAITVWSKESVPPAHPIPSDAIPPAWQGLLWGTLPMGCSIFAILFVLALPDRRTSTGLTPAAAKQQLARVNCRMGKVSRRYVKGVKKGLVFSQKPRFGAVLRGGGKVNLVVSRGRKRS